MSEGPCGRREPIAIRAPPMEMSPLEAHQNGARFLERPFLAMTSRLLEAPETHLVHCMARLVAFIAGSALEYSF